MQDVPEEFLESNISVTGCSLTFYQTHFEGSNDENFIKSPAWEFGVD